MARPIRRIVTGHDAQNRSIIVADGRAPSIFEPHARPGEAITELWRRDAADAHAKDGRPARHQSRLGQSQRQALPYGLHPDRRRAALAAVTKRDA